MLVITLRDAVTIALLLFGLVGYGLLVLLAKRKR